MCTVLLPPDVNSIAVNKYIIILYYIHVPIVLKSESLNLLELSGPLQACNGRALPLHVHKYVAFKLLVKKFLILSIGIVQQT
jgi:hypothetical protein